MLFYVSIGVIATICRVISHDTFYIISYVKCVKESYMMNCVRISQSEDVILYLAVITFHICICN